MATGLGPSIKGIITMESVALGGGPIRVSNATAQGHVCLHTLHCPGAAGRGLLLPSWVPRLGVAFGEMTTFYPHATVISARQTLNPLGYVGPEEVSFFLNLSSQRGHGDEPWS